MMTYLNVLYFSDFDSQGNVVSYKGCDIISVPDFVANNAEKIAQSFFRWLESDEATDDYYYIKDNHKFIICDTRGFVQWLNIYICPYEQSSIVMQHTEYCSCYGIIDF